MTKNVYLDAATPFRPRATRDKLPILAVERYLRLVLNTGMKVSLQK